LTDGVQGTLQAGGEKPSGVGCGCLGPTFGELGIESAADSPASAADRTQLATASDSVSDHAPPGERPDDDLDFLDLPPRLRLLWNAFVRDIFSCKTIQYQSQSQTLDMAEAEHLIAMAYLQKQILFIEQV
jgi:hypothetical protein